MQHEKDKNKLNWSEIFTFSNIMKKLFTLLALMTLAIPTSWAQTDLHGRKVKRITFDREQVTIDYADGTTTYGVPTTTIFSDKHTTGVKSVKPEGQASQRTWYTIDGRTLQGEPRQKGVYVVREKNGVKKTIKK